MISIRRAQLGDEEILGQLDAATWTDDASPPPRRLGAGRHLVEAAVEEARKRGARKLSLRVLGGNTAARRLYEACGFVVEGILRDQFLLGDRYVDDIFMARYLVNEEPVPQTEGRAPTG